MGDVWSAIAQYGIVPVVVGVVLYLLIYFQQKHAERKKTAQENKDKRLEEEQRQDYETKRREQELAFETKVLEMVREIIDGPKHTAEEQSKNVCYSNNFGICVFLYRGWKQSMGHTTKQQYI